jgi:hypothetical protein
MDLASRKAELAPASTGSAGAASGKLRGGPSGPRKTVAQDGFLRRLRLGSDAVTATALRKTVAQDGFLRYAPTYGSGSEISAALTKPPSGKAR